MKKYFTPPSQQQGVGAPASPAPEQRKSSSIDFKQYFHIVVKRIWIVALCFVISLAVMVTSLVRQVPVYRSSATLLLSQGLPLPRSLMQQETELIRGADYLITQQRIMNSPMLVNRAYERLSVSTSEARRSVKRIAVNQIWRTSMMSITVESLDPGIGAEFANALAQEYLDFKAEERMNTSQATVISLTQQANRLREELNQLEVELLAFEKDNSVVAIQERGNVAAQYLSSLSSEIASLRTQRMLLEAQQPLLLEADDEVVLESLIGGPVTPAGSIAFFRGSGTNMPGTLPIDRLSDGSSSLIEQGVVQGGNWWELKRSRMRAQKQLELLRQKYKDAHPQVQELQNQLEQLKQALQAEVEIARERYYSKLEAMMIKEQAVRRAEAEWEEQALEVAKKSHEYQNLQRGVSRLRGLYDLVFNRLKEIDISIGIEPESVRILEPAIASGSPVTPRKVQSVFLAALIGLAIGVGLALGLEFIDDSLRYPDEVTQGLGLSFFGVIPSASWDPDDLRSHMLSNIDQKSGLAEAYRNIRSSLLFSGAQEFVKTIVFSSAVPKEGKTTTCLNLAVSLAQAGSRVLIVDGDLRRGELHKFFGLDGGRGFSDILIGQAKPEAVIQRSGIPNLDIIATGPFPPNPAELMLRPELQAFFDYAKRSYDRILFDCPPVMAVSESGILASMAEGVIFVVWAGQTSRKLSQSAVQVLRERGANILGCVLNNLEFGRVGYYYYSTYYGQYDYDYYDKS